MRFEIFHRTRYDYVAPVTESFNEVRLQPISNDSQTVDGFLLKVLPPTRLRHYSDFYRNCVHHFEIPEPHRSLSIEAQIQVTTHPLPPLAEDAMPCGMERLPEALGVPGCYDFLQPSRYVDVEPQTWKLALDAVGEGCGDVWQVALRLMRFVHGYLAYESNSTTVHTHMRDVLNNRCGVCQDYAHVLLGLCRSLRIPARYVSGYLATEVASATHAWTEVFIPGDGWRGLDPTHNRQPDEQYVKIATGRDYADVPPVSGNYKGTQERTMTVDVQVKAMV